VEEKHVNGWDDPRMPTISGLRRRGYTPSSIRTFAERIGVAKNDSVVDIALLEYCIREELNKSAIRAMAVLRPLKVVITNFDSGVEYLDAINNPEDPESGSRKIPFTKEIYIEQEDFQEVPQPKFFRLSPGKEVRLRYAYFIKCERVIKDENTGEIIELHCTYDKETRGGSTSDGRKVKATLHWVSATEGSKATVRLYDHLFTVHNPGMTDGVDFRDQINPNSLEVINDCYVEPLLKEAKKEERFQFERQGYFFVDPIDSSEGNPVFNRIVTLKDTWAKIQKKESL
jgi:glutaminyl-tRNA synthetase